jgi:hypothetical protein
MCKVSRRVSESFENSKDVQQEELISGAQRPKAR